MSSVGVAGFNIFWRLWSIARLVLPGFMLAVFKFVLYADASMMNLV